MLERRDDEAAFVWSLVTDVMRADLWLWHEPRFRRAQHLLSYCRFRLILLSAGYDGRLSLRALVRTIQGLAHGSPIILRLPPEDMTARLDPRVYGVSAVVPSG